MSSERKTLWELQPERFVIPGRVEGPPIPDLVFTRDPSMPGLYRALLPLDFLTRRDDERPPLKIREA